MSLPRIAPYPMPSPSALPENRVPWRPDPQRAVLLVHDMQRHFLGAFDADAEPVPALLENIAALARRCRALGIPVLFSAQPAAQTLEQRGLLQDFWGDGIPAADGAEIVPELAPEPSDRVLTKWRYSAMVRTELREALREHGRDQLLVCGIYGHIGCLMTACHAFMEEVEPFLVADAIADFSPADHAMALKWAAERCAVVTCVDDVLAALAVEPAAGLTRERMHDDLVAVLADAPPEVAGDENLVDLGLDSLRLMELVARWRDAGGELAFEALVEVEPTLDAWWEVARGAARGEVGAAR